MLSQEQLIAYLEGTLSAAERAQVETLLVDDPAAQRQLAEQRGLDQALHVLLGDATSNERVKQSILAVVRAAPVERLKARVLEDTSAAQPTGVGTQARWIANLLEWASGTWAAWAPEGVRAWELVRRLGATRARRLAAATVSVGLVLAACFFWLKPSPAPVEIGKFISVMGTPKVQHRGERSTLNPQPSASVYLGDRIETGDADKAELQFHDGTRLSLNFNTTIQIPNPDSRARGPTPVARPPAVRLLLGQLSAKVQAATNLAEFAVHTPVATAAVRGTEFGLKVQRAWTNTSFQSAIGNPQSAMPLMAVLTVKEGRVEFSNRFGTVEATELTESVATGNAAPTAPRRVASLKAFWIKPEYALVMMTSRPSLPEAGYRLVYRGGWAGLAAANVAVGTSGQGANTSAIPEQVRVVRVRRNSPAERAGLQVGDVILALNGRAITNAWEVTAAIFSQAGIPITLTLASQPGLRLVILTTTAAPSAPPLPPLSRPAGMALETASRWLLEHRSDEGERALGQLLRSEAGAAAHNNLGLLYETKDELAQALAHYQQAVAAAPQVALYHFNYGLALQNIGNLERAAEELELASSLAPSWDEAFAVLSEILSPLGRHADALRAVDAALSLNPQSPDLWVSRGWVLTHASRPQEARQALLKALELEPAYAAACRDLGDLCHHEDQLDEAERLLRKAIQLDASDAEAFNTLGAVYNDQGRYPEAEQSLRHAIRLDPKHAIAHSNLGLVYRRRNQPDEAEKLYRRAIALDPGGPVPYTNLGELYRKTGQLDEAERMLRTGIDLDPQNVTAINNLGGLYHYNRRQFDEAEKIYRRVTELDPTYFPVFYNLGYLFVDRGNLDEAEKMFRKVTELNPGFARGYGELGYVHMSRRQFDEAEKMYRKAIELDSSYAIAYGQLGQICATRGQQDEAVKLFRKTLELDPNYVSVCNQLARLLADANTGLDEALALAERALKTATNNPALLDTLGWVQCQRGQLVQAESALRQALALFGEKTNAATAWIHLGRLSEKKAEAGAAVEAYRKALSLQPDLNEAKEALQRLGQ